MILDPRVRSEHVAKYGDADTERYLSVIANVPTLPDGKRGENHHLLARSIWPQYANLNENPWNRLRVSRAVHIALTQLQGEFDERFRIAALRMSGLTVEAHFEMCSRAGRKGGTIAVTRGVGIHALTHEQRSANGRRAGHIGGRKNAKSGHLKNLATFESCSKGGRIGGRRNAESGQIMTIATFESRSKAGKKGGEIVGRKNIESGHLARINHIRWHVNRDRVNPKCSLCVETAKGKS